MVSTRSVKLKFTEGEKVLCYEPDPLKSKVLYNSKVLGISSRRDDQGKKVIHFLIHFQGWNSTWDRFVTEDFVLKDTEENRQLQKELAKKAYLTALGFCRGGILYKRERGGSRVGNSRAGPSGLRGGGGAGGKLGEAKGGAHGGGGGESDEDDLVSPPLPSPPLILPLPPSFKRLLELDHHMITSRNKVMNLPAEPNAVTILELFVKDYAVNQMKLVTGTQKGGPRNQRAPQLTLETFVRNINICREVVDGIRLYLDFMLEKVLLYGQERNQFQLAKTNSLQRIPKIKEENDDSSQKKSTNNSPLFKDETYDLEDGRKRSLRSHSAAITAGPCCSSSVTEGSGAPAQIKGHHLRHSSSDGSTNNKHPPETRSSARGEVSETGSLGKGSAREQEVLNRILSWNLIPESVKNAQPSLPCLVYGATHLARLFVKLPEFLQRSTLNTPRNNLLIEYLNYFMKYLEDHPQWFGEDHYRDNIDETLVQTPVE